MALDLLFYVLALPALYLWGLWYTYILVMGLYRAHLTKKLTGLGYVLALPALLVGYVVDCLANMTIAALVFRELPHEMLVTTRLKRYLTGPPGWRRDLASDVCSGLLDYFDPTGAHCHEVTG